MTRTATKPGRAKRALDATPWKELSAGSNSLSKGKKPLKTKVKGSVASSITQTELNVKVNKKLNLTKEMKRVRKGESRRLKRIAVRYSDKQCFNCRKQGHTLSQCPLNNKQTEGTGMCFKCGSLNHMSRFCKVKSKGQGAYPYATCFVCKKSGHISKDCPDNDHGLYPNGGCCLECGSVRHLRRDCPEKQKKLGITNYTLSTMSNQTSADLEPSRDEIAEPLTKKKKFNKRKTKIVTMT